MIFFRQLWHAIKASMLTGLIVLIPVAVTIFIIIKAFSWFDSFLPGLVGTNLFPGLGLVSMVVIILLTGVLARNYLGKHLIRIATGIFSNLPVLGKVYQTLQQIMDLLFNQKESFKGKVVVVEYPRPGCFALGFVTTEETGEISAVTGQTQVGVYIPTTPNPTSGFMLYLPREQVSDINLNSEAAIKAIVSAGIVSPGRRASRADANTPLAELLSQWMKEAGKGYRHRRHDPRD